MRYRSSFAIFAGLLAGSLDACGGESARSPGGSDGTSGAPSPPGTAGAQSPANSAGLGGAEEPALASSVSGLAGALDPGSSEGGHLETAGSGGFQSAPTAGERNGGSGAPANGGQSASLDWMAPPANCTSLGQSEGPDTCSYDFSCDAETHFASCQRERDDMWACQCGTFSTETQYFELRGASGVSVCGMIARACVGDVPDDGTRTCEKRERSADVDAETCSALDSCGPALELGPGLTARRVEHHRADCQRLYDAAFPESYWRCTCSGGAFHGKSYTVHAPAIDAACDPMVAFCTQTEPPTFSGPETCFDEVVQNSNETRCQFRQTCGQSLAIGADVSLFDARDRSVSCEPKSGNVSACYCFNGDDRFDFDANVGALPQACLAAIELCSPFRAIERSGDVTCTERPVDPMTTGSSLCLSGLSCSEPIKSSGREILASGGYETGCEQAQGGPWACSCDSFEAQTMFELDGTLSGPEACSEAARRCPQELELRINLDYFKER